MSNNSAYEIRAKRNAPPDIQRLIDLANSVPPDVRLPELSGEGVDVLELVSSESFASFRQLTGGVEPDQFLERLIGPGAPKTYNRVIANYLLLRDARALLTTIASIPEVKPRAKARWLLPHLQILSVRAQTDEHGRLEFSLHPFLTALRGIKALQIRRCPICMRFFWAARKDQPCCSTRCASARRMRLWRKSYLPNYKLQRARKAEKVQSEVGKNQAARREQERKELEKLKIPMRTTRRPPRLPRGPRR